MLCEKCRHWKRIIELIGKACPCGYGKFWLYFWGMTMLYERIRPDITLLF
jgi:hypothetical protein